LGQDALYKEIPWLSRTIKVASDRPVRTTKAKADNKARAKVSSAKAGSPAVNRRKAVSRATRVVSKVRGLRMTATAHRVTATGRLVASKAARSQAARGRVSRVANSRVVSNATGRIKATDKTRAANRTKAADRIDSRRGEPDHRLALLA
jgi:hypothetical protein